jgi:hypothetical protein
MFNIQEIPFLKNVICSHKMVYNNGVSGEAVYNKNGAYAKQKMDEMWREILPFYKRANILKDLNFNINDSLEIKKFYVNLFKEKNISNVKSERTVDYMDIEKISKFFDIENGWFSSHLRNN